MFGRRQPPAVMVRNSQDFSAYYGQGQPVATPSAKIVKDTSQPGSSSSRLSLNTGPAVVVNAKNYVAIQRDFVTKGVLFDDPEFPATDTSLFHTSTPGQTVDWLRPFQLTNQPLYISSRLNENFRVTKGLAGDAWLLGALAAIGEKPVLLEQILDPSQSFARDSYAGMFRFRLWSEGKWRFVVIDDRLPCLQGQPIGLRSNAVCEFWPALLEKAYAKLAGSYEALKERNIADALAALTGGVSETFSFVGQFANIPKNIINVMFKALERQSLLVCGTYSLNSVDANKRSSRPPPAADGELLPCGLIAGHVYSVTDMREIRLITDQGEIPIVLNRLRNPYGDKVDWNGPFSDKSPEWNSIPEEDRIEMGLVCRDAGEFWMEFRDFLDNFDQLSICNLVQQPAGALEQPPYAVLDANLWPQYQFAGSWTQLVSAGGRAFCRDTHWLNPQYRVSLRAVDDEEENLCTLVVELTQLRSAPFRQSAFIGFYVYKCVSEFPSLPLDRAYFDKFNFVASTKQFVNAFTVAERFLLEPGDYVVMPCCYQPDIVGQFTLRLMVEKSGNLCSEVAKLTDLSGGWLPSNNDNFALATQRMSRALPRDANGQPLITPQSIASVVQGDFEADIDLKSLSKLLDASLVATVLRCSGCLETNSNDTWGAAFAAVVLSTLGKLHNGFAASSRSLSMPAQQMRPALMSLDLYLADEPLTKLLSAVGNSVDFATFVRLVCKIYRARDVYQQLTAERRITLSLDEWLSVAFEL